MPTPEPTEPPDRRVTVASLYAKPLDPDSGVDVTCWLSTDSVDDDNEVLLPDGCDLGPFEKNGPLLVGHDYKGEFYPLPVGQVVWVKKRPRGLLGGIRFARGTEMGRQVKALVEENVLRGVSVGFKLLEASRMTPAEANSRPDWKAAFGRTGGRVNVVRKWRLKELSVTPIPCNEDALIQTLKTKGLTRPEWIKPAPPTEPAMSDAETKPPEGVFDPPFPAERPPDEVEAYAAETVLKASRPEPDDESGDDEPDEDDGPIRNGNFVKMAKGPYKGCVGKVKSVHRAGPVPDVDDDVMGTKADPAMRVCAYKQMGGGHKETAHHFGAKVAHGERCDDLTPPKARKSLDPAPLPPLVGRTDAEVAAETLARVKRELLAPGSAKALVRAEVGRAWGEL